MKVVRIPEVKLQYMNVELKSSSLVKSVMVGKLRLRIWL